MRRILYTALLTVSIRGSCSRAGADWGEGRRGHKKEIMKIEDEKVAGLLRGGSSLFDWIVKYDAGHRANECRWKHTQQGSD